MTINPAPQVLLRRRELPPGFVTGVKRTHFAAGFAVGVVCCLAFAAALFAAQPAEMKYRSAPATIHPTPGVVAPANPAIQIPPCEGSGKDCMPVERGSAQVTAARGIPEPGGLLLIAVGVLWLAVFMGRKK